MNYAMMFGSTNIKFTVEFLYLIPRRHRSTIKFIILSCKLRILSYREFKMCVIAKVKSSITTGRPFCSTC